MKNLSPEAVDIVAKEIRSLRSQSHSELQQYLKPQVQTRVGDSGTAYEVEIQAAWDDKSAQTLRVMVNIAEAGQWRFVDASVDDFIIAPDGSFIGE